MKRGDFVLLAILAIITVSFIAPSALNSKESQKYEGKTYAKIEVDGDLYKQVRLTGTQQDIEIITERGYDLLRISDNGIHVVESDCPEKICMSYGHIDQVGEMIICLPNRMVIEIIGETNASEIDIISY